MRTFAALLIASSLYASYALANSGTDNKEKGDKVAEAIDSVPAVKTFTWKDYEVPFVNQNGGAISAHLKDFKLELTDAAGAAPTHITLTYNQHAESHHPHFGMTIYFQKTRSESTIIASKVTPDRSITCNPSSWVPVVVDMDINSANFREIRFARLAVTSSMETWGCREK